MHLYQPNETDSAAYRPITKIPTMPEKNDHGEELTLEHRILIRLRQVLAAVVRDVTPPPGMRHPLSKQTVEDIRSAFALIAARERELRGDSANPDLPVFADKGATARIVEFDTPEKESAQEKKDKK